MWDSVLDARPAVSGPLHPHRVVAATTTPMCVGLSNLSFFWPSRSTHHVSASFAVLESAQHVVRVPEAQRHAPRDDFHTCTCVRALSSDAQSIVARDVAAQTASDR
jgi:hypothetical protein